MGRWRALLLLIGVALAAWALTAALSRGGRPSRGPAAAGPASMQRSGGPRPERYAQTRAHGLSIQHMTTAFMTPEGLIAGVVHGRRWACLVYSNGLDHCVDHAGLMSGRYLTVSNECSPGRPMTMAIIGLVPASVRHVGVMYSNGRLRTTDVVAGAFEVEGMTPRRGQPYPRAVVWIGSRAQRLARRPFPVAPGEFCHPREVAPLIP